MEVQQKVSQPRFRQILRLLTVSGLLTLTACQPVEDPPTPPRGEAPEVASRLHPTPPVDPGPTDLFVDVTADVGVRFIHNLGHDHIANIMLSNGAGGAVFDYDQDGWMDILFLNWRPLEGVTQGSADASGCSNQLYRNQGDGTFAEVTEAAGLAGAGFSCAATTGDYDNDGYPDLYIANAGTNQLFHNQGDGTFKEVTQAAGVGDDHNGISTVFLDIDRDGFLDLYVVNYLRYDPSLISELNPNMYPGPLAYAPEVNVLYRNRGDGTFEDVSVSSGIRVPQHRGMSVSAFDADRDGDTDLYVSNDDTPNSLWVNDGKGHFHDAAIELGAAFNSIGEACGSMNAAVGDFDGNGRADLFVTRLGYGSLYLRTEPGYYDDAMWRSGLGRITEPYVGWGGVALDFDNDTDHDLFVANGSAFYLTGVISLLLENDGQAVFRDIGNVGGNFFQTPIDGRGSAVLDYDNDGRLDLLVTTLGDRAFVLRNQTDHGRHWLKLAFRGTRSNRDGYGTLVRVQAGEHEFHGEALCPTGFLLQGDPRLHFGLGDKSRADRIEVRWPSGTVQILENVEADQILTLTEPDA